MLSSCRESTWRAIAISTTSRKASGGTASSSQAASCGQFRALGRSRWKAHCRDLLLCHGNLLKDDLDIILFRETDSTGASCSRICVIVAIRIALGVARPFVQILVGWKAANVFRLHKLLGFIIAPIVSIFCHDINPDHVTRQSGASPPAQCQQRCAKCPTPRPFND